MFGLNLNILAAAVLAIVVAAGGGYVKGRLDGGAAADARWQAAAAAEERRQHEASMAALDQARRESDARAVELETLQKQVTDYEDELARRSDGACTLSPDDARRLQSIR